MIKSFKDKGLRQLFETVKSGKVNPNLRKRAMTILDYLNAAKSPEDMRVPGLRFHERHGAEKGIFSVDVNGPWRIVFKWGPDGAFDVELVQDR